MEGCGVTKRKKITAAAARKVLNAYETGVYNPVQAWIRDDAQFPAGVYDELPDDLMYSVDTLHEYLRQVVQAAEQGD